MTHNCITLTHIANNTSLTASRNHIKETQKNPGAQKFPTFHMMHNIFHVFFTLLA